MRVIFHPEFPKDIRTFEADYIGRHDPCLAFALVRVIRGQNPSLSGLWRQKKIRPDTELLAEGHQARRHPRCPHIKFTGSISTVSETSSGKDKVSSNFASDWLSLLICRVRSIS